MRPDSTDLLSVRDLRVKIFQVQMHPKCLKKTFSDISSVNNIPNCSVDLQISTVVNLRHCLQRLHTHMPQSEDSAEKVNVRKSVVIHSACNLSVKKCVCEMIIHYVHRSGEECVKE